MISFPGSKRMAKSSTPTKQCASKDSDPAVRIRQSKFLDRLIKNLNLKGYKNTGCNLDAEDDLILLLKEFSCAARMLHLGVDRQNLQKNLE